MVASPTQLLPLTLLSALIVSFLDPDNALSQRDQDLQDQLRRQEALKNSDIFKRSVGKNPPRVVDTRFERRLDTRDQVLGARDRGVERDAADEGDSIDVE